CAIGFARARGVIRCPEPSLGLLRLRLNACSAKLPGYSLTHRRSPITVARTSPTQNWLALLWPRSKRLACWRPQDGKRKRPSIALALHLATKTSGSTRALSHSCVPPCRSLYLPTIVTA